MKPVNLTWMQNYHQTRIKSSNMYMQTTKYKHLHKYQTKVHNEANHWLKYTNDNNRSSRNNINIYNSNVSNR